MTLRRHLARRAIEALAASAARREAALADPATLARWSSQIADQVRTLLGLGELSRLPLNARLVSRHERQHHVMENILFDSIDGWQTSATLFLPRVGGISPPFPAIVVPCGHSSKTDTPHQLPPQVFARAGYAAITFDPPAQGGEKNVGNDHFYDGPRCYSVGQTSQRYFVADALRAMDYLASRDDIDAARGFAMTGVSGGGYTTMWAALLDPRIKVAAPVCCLTSEADHQIGNLYSLCAETMAIGRLSLGLDNPDLMAAAAPRPQLYMHGLKDEVFAPEMADKAITAIRRVYAALGLADRLEVYAEPCGHEYTVSMARRLVAFVDRHLLDQPGRPHHPAFAQDPALEPREALACHPLPEPNMRSITAARAEALAQARPRLAGRADAARAVRALVRGVEEARIDRVCRGSRSQAICSDVEELLLEHERDMLLPATALWPRGRTQRAAPALVMFDDRGRWSGMLKHGWLAAAARCLDRAPAAAPTVLSVDLRGWGDTAPAPGPYDLTGWSGLDRWPSFVSAALDDGLLAQRVRDGVAACRWLLEQPGVDSQRLVVAGRGLGGVVALMTSALIERACGVVCLDAPESLEAIAIAPQYAWPADALMPRVLEHFDLQGLTEAVAPVLQIRPRDELGCALRDEPDSVAVNWVWQRMGI